MPEKENVVTTYLLIFVTGLAMIFLSHTTAIETTQPALSKAIEAIGFGFIGYVPLEFLTSVPLRFGTHRVKRDLDKLFRSAVKIISTKKEIPLFIAVGVDGCLTPPYRTEIELRKFQKIRAYCELVKRNGGQAFPPLVIYAGRSQGYIELLAQSLGMINPSLDMPFIVENGSALYYPAARVTVPLLKEDQLKTIESTLSILKRELPKNEFEPKSYMITLNAIPNQQTIDELRDQVFRILQANNLQELFTISSTASALDVNYKNINKLNALKEVLNIYHQLRPEQKERGLEDVVALAHNTTDLALIDNVGIAYCPTYGVHPAVRVAIETRFDVENVIDKMHIDFVIEVIERTCGIKLL